MRKLFIFFSVLFFLSCSPAFGQTSSDTLYNDLMNKYRIYQNKLEPYNTAKSRLLSYESVASRAEYLDASKSLLLSETEAVIVYANLIRTRLVEATSVLNYQENLYFIKLDDEITSVTLMNKQVNDISSVSEVESFWKSLNDHYQKISNYGYLIKSLIEIGSFSKINDNLKITKEKISVYISESTLSTTGIKATKDKFSVLDKNYAEITASLAKVNEIHKSGSTGTDFASGSKEIRNIINLSISKTEKIIADYSNIVSSLFIK